jgi:hypothetical protein
MRMTLELLGKATVLAIGDVAAESRPVTSEKEVHGLLREREPRIVVTGTGLVEACPVKLISEVVPIPQHMDFAQQPGWINELQNSDAEELVSSMNKPCLVEEDHARRMIDG